VESLDELLDAYEARKLAEGNPSATREAALRANSIQVLKEVVMPTLQELCNQVRKRGYKCELKDRFESLPCPCVAISFTPNESSPSLTSKLTYAHTETGRIEISQEVTSSSREGTALCSRSREETDLETLDQARVQADGVAFIKAALMAS
jgi:hypothetical protein